jgi:hypothetical protein
MKSGAGSFLLRTMSELLSDSNGNVQWPAQCCVPAFVYAALRIKGIAFQNPATLPLRLGVCVGPDDANPLGLPVVEEGKDHVHGVAAKAVEPLIQALLTDMMIPMFFRYLPVNKVPLDLYEDIVIDALKEDLVVGLGVDVSQLWTISRGNKALHVFRVLSLLQGKITLFDDSAECTPAKIVCDWEVIEQGMLSARGGFWIFGDRAALDLRFPSLLNIGSAQ